MKIRQTMFGWIPVRCMLFVWIFLAIANLLSLMIVVLILFDTVTEIEGAIKATFWIALFFSCFFFVPLLREKYKEMLPGITSGIKKANPLSLYFYWLPYGIILIAMWIANKISYLIPKRT